VRGGHALRWIVGLDEAGYGPNLGPFVMSSVALQVPDGVHETDPWQLLSVAVCKRTDHHPGDPRLIVDDSKAVHSAKHGVAALEQNLWPFLQPHDDLKAELIKDFWLQRVISPMEHLHNEKWINPTATMPVGKDTMERVLPTATVLQRQITQKNIVIGPLRSIVVFPKHFNELADKYDSKAAVTLHAVEQLLLHLPCGPEDDVRIVVDRLGGRQQYQPFLQKVFPDHLVLCRGETPKSSSYQLTHRRTIQFRVQAEQHSFCVALASMLSKYLREVLMLHFNDFWLKQVPGLKPTAGYPGDAARFWKATAGVRQKIGVRDDDWWRKR
jgi:ribonuclease HII